MPRGRVIKNYNGYYYVDPGSGGAVECRRRGKMKEKILVGDMVEFTATGAQKGVIEKTEPRKNSLRRPAVANIDAMFIVMAGRRAGSEQVSDRSDADDLRIRRHTSVALL